MNLNDKSVKIAGKTYTKYYVDKISTDRELVFEPVQVNLKAKFSPIWPNEIW